MLTFCGLDIHRRIVQVCLLDPQGQVLRSDRFPLSPEHLQAYAREHLGPQTHCVVEATTNTWAVVRLLKPLVGEVVVSNPLQTRAIARAKIKTDRIDAEVLAQLLRCDYLPRVWEPDEHTQRLRRLVNWRSGLVADRTGIKNRIHALLAQRLLTPPMQDLFGPTGRAWLQRVELDGDGRFCLESDLRRLQVADEEIARIDAVLAQDAYQHQQVKLLMTLPGVNVICAQTLLAALGEVGRFAEADQAAAYLGLVPSTRQSAEHCYHGPITRQGNGHARWVLVQAAQHVAKHPGPLGAFYRKLKRKKCHNVAVVAVARKLVVIAWHMLRKNEPYRYAQPQTTAAKLARLRVQATGEKRKSGPGKGGEGKKGTGPTRLVKPLAQVYEEEGLPALGPRSAGEARAVAHAGVQEFVESLERSERKKRGSGAKGRKKEAVV